VDSPTNLGGVSGDASAQVRAKVASEEAESRRILPFQGAMSRFEVAEASPLALRL